jgi:hypothetical protein
MRDRDEQARAVGLRVKHVVDQNYRNSLLTYYSGTKKQIAASGFLDTRDPERVKWPKGHIPCRGVVVFAHGGAGLGRRKDGVFYIRIDEDLPANTKRLNAKLERYEVYEGKLLRKIVHYGTKDALVAAGIARAEALPDDPLLPGIRDRDAGWETTRAPMGWWIHEREVGNGYREIGDEALARSERRSALESPVEFCESRFRRIVNYARSTLCGEESSVETGKGVRYTLDPADAARILSAIETAAEGLRTARVMVERLNGNLPEGNVISLGDYLAKRATIEPGPFTFQPAA